MKKVLLLVAFVAAITLSSCTSYTCPTYGLENTPVAPAELAEENI